VNLIGNNDDNYVLIKFDLDDQEEVYNHSDLFN